MHLQFLFNTYNDEVLPSHLVSDHKLLINISENGLAIHREPGNVTQNKEMEKHLWSEHDSIREQEDVL